MLKLAYPNTSLTHDWFVTKPARHTLWRWLFISLALHVLVLTSWELIQLAQVDAVLPIQSGQQAVSVQLVSASSPQQKQTASNDQLAITTNNVNAEAIAQPKTKTATPKTKLKKETSTTLTTHHNNVDESVSVAANLAEGVFSEATPQSSHKPEYPRLAILKNQQGKVVIKLDIDERGQTHNIKLLKSSGFALLDKTVIAFAQMERFIPANRNNSPVHSTQQYSFLFKLI